MEVFQAIRNNRFKTLERGSLLLEILVAISVLSFIAIGISQIMSVSLQSSKVGGQRTVALGIAQEEIEVLRAIIKESWQNIYGLNKGIANKYHISNLTADCGSQKWCLVSGQVMDTLNGLAYTKYIYIDDVSRTTGEIDAVYSLGNDDPSTQKVSVFISWQGGNLDLFEYFTRSRNQSAVQTDWSGVSGQITNPTSGEDANFNNRYDTNTFIDTTVTGSIKLSQ
ncbi:MAG: hypothetical protein AAB614_02015 [Patescibacteria group bacterium]